ncbi:unnamed protein product [Gadus morhua 'NCC']
MALAGRDDGAHSSVKESAGGSISLRLSGRFGSMDAISSFRLLWVYQRQTQQHETEFPDHTTKFSPSAIITMRHPEVSYTFLCVPTYVQDKRGGPTTILQRGAPQPESVRPIVEEQRDEEEEVEVGSRWRHRRQQGVMVVE